MATEAMIMRFCAEDDNGRRNIGTAKNANLRNNSQFYEPTPYPVLQPRDFKMDSFQKFASSTNGDQWFLGTEEGTDDLIVLHRGNEPSGAHETRTPVKDFLDLKPFGPEREVLVAILGAQCE